jgi:vitamin K-dependent gamma-carboxylase
MFKFCYFEWVPRLTLAQWQLLLPAMFASALCFAAGLLYRASAVVFMAGFFVLFFQDLGLYLNHFYMILVFCMLFVVMPANESPLSLDAALGVSRRATTVPYWTVWAARTMISIVYFYAGVAKMNEDWLRCEPLRHWVPNAHTVRRGGASVARSLVDV